MERKIDKYYDPWYDRPRISLEDRSNNALDKRLDILEELVSSGGLGTGTVTDEQIQAAVEAVTETVAERIVTERLSDLTARIEALEAAVQALRNDVDSNIELDQTQAEQIQANTDAHTHVIEIVGDIDEGLDEIIGEKSE